MILSLPAIRATRAMIQRLARVARTFSGGFLGDFLPGFV